MKKIIICLLFSLISFNLFATITKEDLESFYAKAEGCIIIENDYDVFPGYTIYGKDVIYGIFIGHDNNGNAYCNFYIGQRADICHISVSKSYYDTKKNILHLYRKI